MIYVLLLIAFISWIDLRRVYKQTTLWQAILVTLLFAGVLAVCVLTAQGLQFQSLIVTVGDMMKSIGLAYPPLQ